MKGRPNHSTRWARQTAAEAEFEHWWAARMVSEEDMGCLSPEDEEVARAIWMTAYLHYCED